MPTYLYQLVNDDGTDGETFEVVQKMTDPPLTRHPQTGKPVKRLITMPFIAGKWSESGSKQALSDSNLDRLGFTKYQKAGQGHYEKRAGKGPRKISTD